MYQTPIDLSIPGTLGHARSGSTNLRAWPPRATTLWRFRPPARRSIPSSSPFPSPRCVASPLPPHPIPLRFTPT